MNGATGLDGAACVALLERLLPKWQRQLDMQDEPDMAGILEDLHVIEIATLDAWAERREAETPPA